VKLRIFTFIITAIFLFSSFCVFAEETNQPEINAQSAIALHMGTGISAFEKNADEKVFVGCAAKIMTAILAIEKDPDMTQKVEVSEEALKGITSISSAKIKEGEILTVEDLLYCLMVATSNEAAAILAEFVSGTEEEFVKLMNEKAKEIGAQSTTFTNPQGTYSASALTTARDVAKIVGYAYSLDGFMDIADATVYKIDKTNKNEARRIYSNNQLINNVSDYYSSIAKGVKTSATAEGGASLATIGEKKIGNALERVIVVVMGCQKTQENSALNNTFVDCKTLLNWFYNNHKVVTLVKKNEPVTEIKVELSDTKDFALLAISENFSSLVPKNYSSDKLEITFDIPESIMAPVQKGQVVGKAYLKYDGYEYGSVDLISQSDISRSAMLYYSYQLNLFFKNIWVRVISIIIGILFVLYIIYTILYNKSRRKRKRVKRRIKF